MKQLYGRSMYHHLYQGRKVTLSHAGSTELTRASRISHPSPEESRTIS